MSCINTFKTPLLLRWNLRQPMNPIPHILHVPFWGLWTSHSWTHITIPGASHHWNIHQFSVAFILHGEPGVCPRGLREPGHPVPTHCGAQSQIHSFTQYGQFRDVSQSTTHAFGLRKETEETTRAEARTESPTLWVWGKLSNHWFCMVSLLHDKPELFSKPAISEWWWFHL